jgi:hypothetical protein
MPTYEIRVSEAGTPVTTLRAIVDDDTQATAALEAEAANYSDRYDLTVKDEFGVVVASTDGTRRG